MNQEEENALLLKEISSLKEVESNFYFFLENTSDFIYIKDLNHRFTFASNAFAALTNHSSWRDIVGKNDFEIFPKEHAEIYFELEKTIILDGNELLSVEEPYYDKEGKLCWVSSSKRPIYNEKNEIVGLFGISRDITSHKLYEQKLEELSITDALTQTFNRMGIDNSISSELDRFKRYGRSFGIILADIDYFKNVNDTFGHDVGDIVLQGIAQTLKNNTRSTDIVGRWGGEEFLIICPEVEKDSIYKLAEILRGRIEQSDFKPAGKVTCSFGTTIANKDDDLNSLLKKADSALYEAKESGRNRVC